MKSWPGCDRSSCCKCMTSWCSRLRRRRWIRSARWRSPKWRASASWECRCWWTSGSAIIGAMRSRIGSGLALGLLALSACSKPAPKPVVVPEVYRARFETSKGDFVVEVYQAWAPRAARRFDELLRMHYYDESRFHRVLPGFIAQFGIHRDFNVHGTWREQFIVDDPPQGEEPARHAEFRAIRPQHARH